FIFNNSTVINFLPTAVYPRLNLTPFVRVFRVMCNFFS
ncbi:hypothetical protein ACHAWX_007594, partial [Stephanocyclus meneghinianus]